MKISVQPDCARTVPSSAAMVSSVRVAVVPSRPDLAACGTRIVDDPRGLFVHDIILGVHDVVGDLILLDRAERTQTDMQRHERQFYSLGFQRVKQLGREVQAGRSVQLQSPVFWSKPSGSVRDHPAFP